MSPTNPTLSLLSGTASSAKLHFQNPNQSSAKSFFLEYTLTGVYSPAVRIELPVSDASGDVDVDGLLVGKTYIFQLIETGRDAGVVYQVYSNIVEYIARGAPGAPTINSDKTRVFDGACELNVTLGDSNGGSGIMLAFSSQNVSNLESPAVKHYQPLRDPSGNTTFTFIGLTNGDTYEFWVSAINGDGECSVDSNTVQVIPTNCPTKVLNLDATPADSSVKVSWRAPLDLGIATPVITYHVIVEGNGSSNTFNFPIDASGIAFPDLSLNSGVYSYTVKNLVNYTNYKFTVFADSSNGEGLPNSINALPFSSSLDVNGSLKAYPSNKRIDVSWNEPEAISGFPVKLYTVDLYQVSGAKDDVFTKIASQTVNDDPSLNAYTASFSGGSINNGNLYKVAVTVTISNTTVSPAQNVVCTVDIKDSGVFSIPYTSANAVSNYGVNSYSSLVILDWNAPVVTGGYPVIRYDISYVDLSGVVVNRTCKDSSITLTGLTNGTLYKVNITPVTGPVITFNDTNVVPSPEVVGAVLANQNFSATANAPATVTANTVNNLSYANVANVNTQIKLSWKQPQTLVSGAAEGSESTIVNYKIYETNEQGFKMTNYWMPVAADPSWNSTTDISFSVPVAQNSTGYYGVTMTVAYKYITSYSFGVPAYYTTYITSNMQFIEYSTGSKPVISLIDISNVETAKTLTSPASVLSTVTVNVINNNSTLSSVVCFAPDLTGGNSLAAATKIAGIADINTLNATTKQVKFTFNYKVDICLVVATNAVGSVALEQSI